MERGNREWAVISHRRNTVARSKLNTSMARAKTCPYPVLPSPALQWIAMPPFAFSKICSACFQMCSVDEEKRDRRTAGWQVVQYNTEGQYRHTRMECQHNRIDRTIER